MNVLPSCYADHSLRHDFGSDTALFTNVISQISEKTFWGSQNKAGWRATDDWLLMLQSILSSARCRS